MVRKSLAGVLVVLLSPLLAWCQEGVFLSEEKAPKAVFPEASTFERRVVVSSAELRAEIKPRMGRARTSLWEKFYPTFIAKRGDKILGYAVIVEEIGKHRPITFIVAVDPDGKMKDAAVMVYREPYGGEVKDRRFLAQYDGKTLNDPLLPHRDIVNISGATLSVEAIGRGAKKAMALVDVLYLRRKANK